jgi:hypothetical protein
MGNRQIIVVESKKSVGIALLLTFLFGPIGMFYSTVVGAFTMLVIPIVAYVFILWKLATNTSSTTAYDPQAPIKFILSMFFLIGIYWIACIVWAIWGVVSYNSDLESEVQLQSDQIEREEKTALNNGEIVEWLSENKGKTLNDYYIYKNKH